MKKPQPDVVRRESVWDEAEFRKHVMDWRLDRRDVRAIDRYAEALATVTRVSAWVWEHRIRAGYRASGLSRRTDVDGLASFSLMEGGGTFLWDRMSSRVPLDVETPDEAWERLAVAGLIPVDAVEDPSRRFRSRWHNRWHNRWQNHRAVRAGVLSPCPPHVLTAVAFAADWPAMATAEALTAQARHEDAAPGDRRADEPPFVVWDAVPVEQMNFEALAWRAHQTRVASAPIRGVIELGYVPSSPPLRDAIRLHHERKGGRTGWETNDPRFRRLVAVER